VKLACPDTRDPKQAVALGGCVYAQPPFVNPLVIYAGC
jgi:hypothetical protein